METLGLCPKNTICFFTILRGKQASVQLDFWKKHICLWYSRYIRCHEWL